MGVDWFLFTVSIYLAFCLRFSSAWPSVELQRFSGQILALIIIKSVIFRWKGLYRPILRFTGVEFLSWAAQAVLISVCIQITVFYIFRLPLHRSVLFIDALLTLILVVGSRLGIYWLFRQLKFGLHAPQQPAQRCLIYGAGVAGSRLATSLLNEPNYRLVGFIDDDPGLHEHSLQGVPVFPPHALAELRDKPGVDLVVLAMPSVGKSRRKEIIEELQGHSVLVKTIPSLKALLTEQASISQLTNIDVTELLGREEIAPDPQLLSINIAGRAVLVTGAGGSIGSELCRQIAQLEPCCLVLFELSEFSLYNIDLELRENHPDIIIHACLGSVTDEQSLLAAMRTHQIETVYHAAAYKHVPMVEMNPNQGVYNNVFGTLITAQCAIAAQVKNFVLISTDKAVRPTNVMGASKRIAELTIQALAHQQMTDRPRFALVRFGNVLDSSGSVVPRFRNQIAEGKPITVTHPEITRYFMSIPEAVRLVIQAGALAKGGEVFLLDMGDPIRIYDLAIQMIRLSGLIPFQDIDVQITGLRPGEKLYEELLIDGKSSQPTRHPKIFSAFEHYLSWEELKPALDSLLLTARLCDRKALIQQIKALVHEYNPKPSNQRIR
ncbi:MAG: nucleoside-diphosphate sugar epimerase/dehydratase [Cyanobacteria bacterium P01_H01_bin.15]